MERVRLSVHGRSDGAPSHPILLGPRGVAIVAAPLLIARFSSSCTPRLNRCLRAGQSPKGLGDDLVAQHQQRAIGGVVGAIAGDRHAHLSHGPVAASCWSRSADRHSGQGDRAQPAVGGRGVRRARVDLPGRTPRVAAGSASIGGITSWLPLFLFVILSGFRWVTTSSSCRGSARAMTAGWAPKGPIPWDPGDGGRRDQRGRGDDRRVRDLRDAELIDFKEMGVGLALAVLIDATIVRAVLLAASMKLLATGTGTCPGWAGFRSRPEPGTHHPNSTPRVSSVDVARQDARVSLALHGELDLETAPHFRERLADAEQGADTVVIDLRGVTFMDSCGIGERRAHQRTHREGAGLVVVKGQDTPIDQILHMASSTTRSRPPPIRPS